VGVGSRAAVARRGRKSTGGHVERVASGGGSARQRATAVVAGAAERHTVSAHAAKIVAVEVVVLAVVVVVVGVAAAAASAAVAVAVAVDVAAAAGWGGGWAGARHTVSVCKSGGRVARARAHTRVLGGLLAAPRSGQSARAAARARGASTAAPA